MACMGGLSYIAVAILFVATTVRSDDTVPVPADLNQVSKWFNANVQPLADRKDSLDPKLVAAEESRKVIKVNKDGSGDFKTITDALKSIPDTNRTQRVIIHIAPGKYVEKIYVNRSKPFVTFYGEPTNMPTISFNGDAHKYGTMQSATVAAEAEYFMAVNIIFENTSPRPDGKSPGAQAVALRADADKQAYYNCKFIGFQDTLCDDDGRHFYKDCFIEGTVDFIFGKGKSIFLKTKINVLADKGTTVITASARESKDQDIGFSLLHCTVTGLGRGAWLGRAWMPMPRVVYAYSNFGQVVGLDGWSNNNHPERNPNLFYGEYKNLGVGSKLEKRVGYMTKLTDEQVKPFLKLGYIEASKWLLPPPKL